MRRLAQSRLGSLGQVDAGMPFRVHTAVLAGPEQSQFNAYSHSFSGMTLQYLLFWGMESGLLLLRDRQRSVWTRLCSTPVPLCTLLAGRASATAAIAFLQVLTTFAAGNLLFGVTVTGSWTGFLLLAVRRELSERVDRAIGCGGRRHRSASAEHLHPGHPQRQHVRRTLAALLRTPRLGTRCRVSAPDNVGDARAGWCDLAGARSRRGVAGRDCCRSVRCAVYGRRRGSTCFQ